MKIVKKWVPSELIPANFHIEKILNDTEGLFIFLKNNQNKQTMRIKFDAFWFSYRTVQTECFFKKNKLFQESYNLNSESWSLFQVEESDYLKWFQQESSGIYQREEEEWTISHYLFIGSNFIFEIISYEPDLEIQVIE